MQLQFPPPTTLYLMSAGALNWWHELDTTSRTPFYLRAFEEHFFIELSVAVYLKHRDNLHHEYICFRQTSCLLKDILYILRKSLIYIHLAASYAVLCEAFTYSYYNKLYCTKHTLFFSWSRKACACCWCFSFIHLSILNGLVKSRVYMRLQEIRYNISICDQ